MCNKYLILKLRHGNPSPQFYKIEPLNYILRDWIKGGTQD